MKNPSRFSPEKMAQIRARAHAFANAPAHAARRAPPGWGDRLKAILDPIARRLDRRFGTHLAQCPTCSRRRTWLNHLETRLKTHFTRLAIRLKPRRRGP